MSINIHYTDQKSHLRGLHRSGWAYVVSLLEQMHSEDGILCDTFVDRTFLFNTDPGIKKIIPYTVPWIGFVHHPFDKVHSSSDSHALIQSETFQNSLVQCKGLFVFGEDMKQRWRDSLDVLGHKDVWVISLVHPSETPSVMFDMAKMLANPAPSIVQVGAHLRNTYAIFELNDGKCPVGKAKLHKAALVGEKMDGMYVSEQFFEYLLYSQNIPQDQGPANPVIPSDQQSISSVNANLPDVLLSTNTLSEAVASAICRAGVACRNSFNNTYLLGALKVLRMYDQSVAIVPTLSNEDFDDLLSKNVVFLELYRSATTGVNTIIECILRNTPLVVNRIPATVELLGADYPLFYENVQDVPNLLTPQALEAAHFYLRDNVSKEKFSGETFKQAFTSVIQAL